MRLRHTIVLCFLVAAGASHAAEPSVKWSFRARTNLYASPLVADVVPASPGLETIIADSELRTLRCLDAQGNSLWSLKAGWKKRLIQSPALSFRARPGRGILAIPNGDSSLRCIDARTGTVLWTREVGAVEWGGVVWADLRGVGRDALVVGTYDGGVKALDATGKPLWVWAGQPRSKAPTITCPLAAADVDGDTLPEIFAATKMGPICLSATGTLRWEHLTGDDFDSSPTIADADHDGKPELYCTSTLDNALWCFDARSGAERWEAPLSAGSDVYPGSSIAVGDIDADGKDEIVFADAEGTVYCFGCDGSRRWAFPTPLRVSASVSLGDVDGDGEVEALAACQDHCLYCLDSGGGLKWKYRAGLRLMLPATIADVDGDGKTDILFGGSDHMLRCLTLGGRYDPSLIPWPARRFDPAQSGAPLGVRSAVQPTVTEQVPLLANGGFEVAKTMLKEADYPTGTGLFAARSSVPLGWTTTRPARAGEWSLDGTKPLDGKRSLRVAPAGGALTVASGPVEIARGLSSVDVCVYRRGAAGAAVVRWLGVTGVLREDALAPSGERDQWTRLGLKGLAVPVGARWLSITLSSEPGASVAWDGAEAIGVRRRPQALRALVNQVGYDIGAPKRFTVQANFAARIGRFEIVAPDGSVVYSGALESKGRIVGAHNSDWGKLYWRGDFTGLDKQGKYRVRVTLDGMTDTSWPFAVAKNLIAARTTRPAYRFFYYQRCGMAIPGYHGACHLDDATNQAHTIQYHVSGGWHDAGDYNTYQNSPYVFGLARAYEAAPRLFATPSRKSDLLPGFLDEVVWGAQHIARMVQPDGSVLEDISSGYGYWGPPEIETDNIPGTGDERPVVQGRGVDPSMNVAALAKVARFAPKDRAAFVRVAERAMHYVVKHNIRNPLIFSGAVDLYILTHKPQYARQARALFADFGLVYPTVTRAYDRVLGENHSAELAHSLIGAADSLVGRADNPFGFLQMASRESPNYFLTPAADQLGFGTDGHNFIILDAAARVAEAYAVSHDPRYLAFVYDQINWILGANPYDLCMMEGAGSLNAPSYHNRLTFAGVPRGAVPGGIPNGITWSVRGEDKPNFDMRGTDIPSSFSNEMWLPHNTNYVIALACLSRCRAAGVNGR